MVVRSLLKRTLPPPMRMFLVVVCSSVSNFAQKLPNGCAWNFQGRLTDIAALVKHALAKVCTVPVLLVLTFVILPYVKRTLYKIIHTIEYTTVGLAFHILVVLTDERLLRYAVNVGTSLILHCVSKNVPHVTCYDLDTHEPITIIFGRSVNQTSENLPWNQTMFYFPISPV